MLFSLFCKTKITLTVCPRNLKRQMAFKGKRTSFLMALINRRRSLGCFLEIKKISRAIYTFV